jgi:multidrug efflux pump subunit AcrA (membrane-fusion protein)
VVNYPVTIKIIDTELSGVRPGMTAVADLLSDDLAGSWLVPSSAVREQDDGAVVMIVRDGQPSPVSVTTQGTQGDWTIVQSPELQEGDMAMGTVTSYVNKDSDMRFGGGMLMGGGGPPPR